MPSSNQRLFADKLRFLTGLTSSPVADSNLQEFVDAFTLPSTDGDSDQVLKTDGEGLITFGSASSGGGGVDSATVLGLIDSAHVQLRQDYSYASLTGAPNVLDSADVSLIAGDAGVDSATVLSLIDSAHVQLSAIGLPYSSLTATPNVLDSADVSLIAGSSAGVDSATVLGLIDSAHVQLRQDYAYASLTGSPNVLDSADVSLIAGSGGVDSATVLGLIDSAHVQLRQDYSYASLTGTPNVLDSADVSLIAGSGGVDSATVLGLIDSAHVQLRQDYAYASLTGVPNVLDSADVSSIAGGSGGGLDSSLSISLINTTVDSAYVQSKITSSTIYTRTITTATASQTVFAATYTPNYVDVFVNGIKILNTTDFTATNGTSVTLLSSSDAGDIVEITAWVPTAIVGSVSAWVSVDSALTLYSGQRALADTTSSPVTLTLPSSPNLGDEVRVIDATNNAATNNITVARNGSKIMGLDSDLTVNINEAAFGLVYFNASRGWLLTEK